MTTTAHDLLEKHYYQIESRYSILSSGKYTTLVTANGNSATPIHRWFRMKEAYSSEMLGQVLNDTGLDALRTLRLVDPFSGSGTTGVSAGDLIRRGDLDESRVTAMEVNPFLHLVSRAKMSGHMVGPLRIQTVAGHIARRALTEQDGLAAIPSLTTFANPEYFPTENLRNLLALKASLTTVLRETPDAATSDLLHLALASAIEPSSNLRRDGRALRLTAGKARTNPINIFLDAVETIAHDIDKPRIPFTASVSLQDSRRLPQPVQPSHDLALFSPPYPNNIDYTEVYKLEAWFLGLYSSADDFSLQRRQTVRSHSSLRWGEQYGFRDGKKVTLIEALLAPVLDAIPDDRYRRGRQEVVLGYADDMLATLQFLHASLDVGGRMAIAVGNSMHGKAGNDYVIASDLLLAQLAEIAGFHIDKIDIARYPKRRTARSAYLRESLVFATKERQDA